MFIRLVPFNVVAVWLLFSIPISNEFVIVMTITPSVSSLLVFCVFFRLGLTTTTSGADCRGFRGLVLFGGSVILCRDIKVIGIFT